MYVAVVLSITIREAYAGTEMFDATANAFAELVTTKLPDVTAPLVYSRTVAFAAVLDVLAATTWLTLNTLEDPLVLAISTSVDVFAGVKKFV
jgi:hypothetical protein